MTISILPVELTRQLGSSLLEGTFFSHSFFPFWHSGGRSDAALPCQKGRRRPDWFLKMRELTHALELTERKGN